MRLFVAVMLEPPVRDALAPRLGCLLASAGKALRRVPPGSEHVTLAFLGDVRSPLEHVFGTLGPVASREPFPFVLGRFGLLGSPSRPRLVLAEPVAGGAAMAALAEAVHRCLASLPEGPSSLPRPPHVTLARFRRGAGRADAVRVRRALEEELGGWTAPGQTVDRIQVVRSRLGPLGPRYEVVGEVGLGGPGSPL